MTISSDVRKAGPFSGNDATTIFPFTFKCFTSDDLLVIFTSDLGVESTLVLDSAYTVTLNLDQNANPGGNVTYSLLATGELLTILGNVNYRQETDIQNQGGFYPEVIEEALDKLTMQTQQLKEEVDRSVKVGVSSPIDANELVASLLVAEINAAASAATASNQSSIATTQATSASTSASTATTQAGIATTQATNASNSATNAGTAEANSLSSANTATTQAGIATTQAGIATTQASNASTSASDAAASYDSFDDRYLGVKSSNPTLDNDGNTLQEGAIYWNSIDKRFLVWNSTSWVGASLGVPPDNSITPIKLSSGAPSWSPAGFNINTSLVNIIPQTPNTVASLEVGAGRTLGGESLIDLVTTPNADYNARIIRHQGVNGALDIENTGTGVISFTNGGSTRFSISPNGSQHSVIPGGSVLYPEFKCRAWVNFNGTGTVAIRASGNVSSITDNGAGDYFVNFTTAMPDANYALSGAVVESGGFNRTLCFSSLTPPAAGSCRISVSDNSATRKDEAYISASFHI